MPLLLSDLIHTHTHSYIYIYIGDFLHPFCNCCFVCDLTRWSRDIIDKLAVAQLVNKFLAFYGTRKFIAVFTTARHRSVSRAVIMNSLFYIAVLTTKFKKFTWEINCNTIRLWTTGLVACERKVSWLTLRPVQIFPSLDTKWLSS
jgi:hypothetical protein